MAIVISKTHLELVDGNRLVGEMWIEADHIIWRSAHGREEHKLSLKDFKTLIEDHGVATPRRS